MESAGEMIKRYREALDLSQEDVGLGVGVSFGAVSQWENGRVNPRRATAYRLDEMLGAGGEIVAALGYALPSDPDHPNPTNRELLDVLLSLELEMGKILEALESIPELAAVLGRQAPTAGSPFGPASS